MQFAKNILRSIWICAIFLVLVPTAASAKCVLCVNGICGVINDLNCSALVLAPSDICRDVLGIAKVETASSSARYVVVDGTKYRLMSDEAQVKLDQLVRDRKGNLQSEEIGKELAPIIAKRGPISEARVRAIIGGTTNCYAPPCPGEETAAKTTSVSSPGIVEDESGKGCTERSCPQEAKGTRSNSGTTGQQTKPKRELCTLPADPAPGMPIKECTDPGPPPK